MGCSIRSMVEYLLKEKTLEELKKDNQTLGCTLAIMNIGEPFNKDSEEQKEQIKFLIHCHGMAIMIKEEEN
ncbi:MAG: hypothetical protein ACR2M6_02645 [Vampirovibrionia bacterium]